MTQTLIPSTPTGALAQGEVNDALWLALLQAERIETTEPATLINGRSGATYGALIRFETERLADDPRGPRWAAKLDSYVLPADARAVRARMDAEGRAIFAVVAVRGALGGTVRA